MLTPVSLTIPRLTNYTKYDNAHVTSAHVNALLAFDPTSYVLKENFPLDTPPFCSLSTMHRSMTLEQYVNELI
jgi:hypothetical protein